MPIPGTDIPTTAELAGQMIQESRSDTLHAADRARRAEVEAERLRGLLAVARDGISRSLAFHERGLHIMARVGSQDALRRSDPDATPGDES